MRVKVFGRFAEMLGNKLEVEAATVGELLDRLRSRYPVLQHESILVAVNHDLVQDPDRPLTDGDEVAVFPPVAGG